MTSVWRQLLLAAALFWAFVGIVDSKLADRSRIVKARLNAGHIDRYHDNGRPIEGQGYRARRGDNTYDVDQRANTKKVEKTVKRKPAPWQIEAPSERLTGTVESESANINLGDAHMSNETPEEFQRRLSSQLSGCCYTYQGYSAQDLCNMYGNDCESGETPSHDSGDESCSQKGLSFIGISFSVNTASGNPYSYQLCDQFPMENIIDRDYKYIMSMDEDGWLVGGGYKTFDYSGKMPYIDSSHTELLRIGSMDPNSG